MNNVVKKLQPRNWRTEKMHHRYETEREVILDEDSCPMCEAESLQEFTHWRIVKNIYPYDAVATVHDMIVPKRHFSTDSELLSEEREELFALKKDILNAQYTFILEALPKNRSIPGHFHLHLIVPKIIT